MPVLYLCITQPKRYFTPQLGKYFSVVRQTIGDEQAEKEAGGLLVVNGGLVLVNPPFTSAKKKLCRIACFMADFRQAER